MDSKMYFGTREYMQYIPCPSVGGDHSGVGWNTSAQYMNGGAWERNSSTSHREFQMSWSLYHREELQPLYDYAAGIYGDGALYFIDPFAADKNVLPEWWAAPGMATLDAPVLAGSARPTRFVNVDQTQRYPRIGATYDLGLGSSSQKLWIPIPPGKTLWIGAHGPTSATASVNVLPFSNATTSGTATALSNLSTTSATRFSDSFSSSDGWAGVEISLEGTGFLTLVGIIAQVIDTGLIPDNGGFIGGMGHSGCSFRGKPTKLAYNSAMDYIGASATLVETEGWE